MLRVLWLSCLAAAFIGGAGAASAQAVADRGPPYTDEQFLALAPYRLPTAFRRNLADWWKRAPLYLKSRVLGARSEMWWFIILCNYQGFKPEGMEAGGAEKCERDAYQASQRGRKSWTEDGQWVGPSEECRRRDKRTQWGELVCD